jgi:hypothetical protein
VVAVARAQQQQATESPKRRQKHLQSNMSTDAKTLLDLPHKVLDPICPTGTKPTFRTLRVAQLQLNMNAISVRSHRGDGTHGHLVLTLTPAAFLLQTAVPFVVPPMPLHDPVHVAGATAAQITEDNRIHAAARAEFNLYHDTDNALRALLIAAVPYKYIEAIAHPTMSFAQTTTQQLLAHLWATYGKINVADLMENLERMQAPWHPDQGIDALFAQLKHGREYAAAGNNPITDISAMSYGYANIEQTGLFEVACREWRLTPADAQTWANFEAKFRLADDDHGRTRTSHSAGYHRTNAATTPATIAPTATATPSNPAPRPVTRPPAGPRPITSYCWTHGLLRSADHTSANCKNKGENHQDGATMANKMGGATTEWKPRRDYVE